MPEIGYADLYQLASVVAVEFAGGPAIPFRLGRKVICWLVGQDRLI